MPIIESVQNISGLPMPDKVSGDGVFPNRTFLIKLDREYRKFDARDVREYVEKFYPNIFELDNGIIILSGSNLVVTFKDGVNLQNVRDKAEELFSKPLKEIRDAIGRQYNGRI